MKSFFKSILTLSLLSVLFIGCASVNSVSITPIPKERSNKVRAEVSKIIILGFNFDNDFIDALVPKLQQQCPNGKVTGLLTKDEVISYFLVFKKQVTATGYCVTNASATNSTGKRSTASSDEEN